MSAPTHPARVVFSSLLFPTIPARNIYEHAAAHGAARIKTLTGGKRTLYPQRSTWYGYCAA